MIHEEIGHYEITMTERILGSQPKSQKLHHDFIRKRALEAAEKCQADVTTDQLDEEESMISDGEKGMTGFFVDPDGCYLLDYQLKGFLKEAANRLKESCDNPDSIKTLGIKNLRDKIGAYLFVFPRYIWIAEKPDGIFERSLRAQTMQGPRVTLAASEYLDPPIRFNVELYLLPHRELNWDVVEHLLDYGRFAGLGQWRGGGFGRFTFKRLKVVRADMAA